jgi:DNA invertase Pin-like site-specific DNA recombinase
MTKYVAYYRVSTDRQGRSGLGLEAQQASIEAFLESHPKASLVDEHREVESGRKDDRPKLTAALATCRALGATLLIAKFDRLSRDAHFLLGLQKSGVKFVAADMPDANELTVGIMAVVAQAEGRMISKRTKEALARSKKKLGGYRGGPAPSDASREKSLMARREKAKAHAENLRHIVEGLKEDGVTGFRGIARRLTEIGAETVTGKDQWTPTGVKVLLERL